MVEDLHMATYDRLQIKYKGLGQQKADFWELLETVFTKFAREEKQ